jgi:hypothetical protein
MLEPLPANVTHSVICERTTWAEFIGLTGERDIQHAAIEFYPPSRLPSLARLRPSSHSRTSLGASTDVDAVAKTEPSIRDTICLQAGLGLDFQDTRNEGPRSRRWGEIVIRIRYDTVWPVTGPRKVEWISLEEAEPCVCRGTKTGIYE